MALSQYPKERAQRRQQMKKKDLIEALKKYIAVSDKQWLGQKIFAEFLCYYLEQLSIPADERYDFWKLDTHLPQILVDAFEELRIGECESIINFRKKYEEDTGFQVPEILNINTSGNPLHRVNAIQTMLCFLMRDVTGNDYIVSQIKEYCFAQDNLLQSTFDKFLRLVYRKGMFDLIDKCTVKGMHGTIGTVEILTFSMCGRTQIQFNHVDKEQYVSFIAEEDDSQAYSAGINSVGTDVHTGCALIEEVIKNWPLDTKLQQQVFVPGKPSYLTPSQ